MKSIIRTTIIIIVVVIIGVIGYKVFFAKSAPAASTSSGLATTAGVGATAPAGALAGATLATTNSLGQEFLSLLLNVQSIKLDDSVFTSPVFLSLQDFSRPIPPDTDPGRPNPFAPIGVDGTITSTQISTSNPSSVTTTASTLNGSLTVGGDGVMRWFVYGTTDALNMQTAPEPQADPGVFIETITGLTPNTTYYAKAEAMIGTQTITGNLVTWKTAPTATSAKSK